MNAVTCLRVASHLMGHLSLLFHRLMFTPSMMTKIASFQDLPEEIAFSSPFELRLFRYPLRATLYQPAVDTNKVEILMGKKRLAFLHASAFLLILLIWLHVLWKFPILMTVFLAYC